MDSRLERLFRLREERDMETDADVKAELHRNFLSQVKRFLVENNLPFTPHEFIHATAEAYHQWRRNPH
ncbi:MAG: hypothetical protein HYY23_04055 [Verrucomicrobia bacterium]|nr:hypothetical protein [Verrucomicrobiota bacterium]